MKECNFFPARAFFVLLAVWGEGADEDRQSAACVNMFMFSFGIARRWRNAERGASLLASSNETAKKEVSADRMNRLPLIVIDPDDYFCEMLTAYVRVSEYADQYHVSCYQDRGTGLEGLSLMKEPFVLLVHESCLPLPPEAVRGTAKVVALSEREAQDSSAGCPVLCKYQPLDRLLSAIAAQTGEYRQPVRDGSGSGAQVVAWYSAAGGSGKTTAAVHAARRCAIRGERVFCLCLERLPSYAKYRIDSDEEALSQLLYYLRTNPPAASAKLEQWKRKQPEWKFDTLPPFRNTEQWEDMDGEDVSRLIRLLQASGAYDRIFLDLDSQLHGPIAEALRCADRIIWLVLDDEVHLGKCALQLSGMSGMNASFGLRQKTSFVVNRWIGREVNNMSAYGIEIAERLPYVPEWKAAADPERRYSPPFAERAAGVLDAFAASGGQVNRHVRI